MRIIEEMIVTGAPQVTAESLDELVRTLPRLRLRFAGLDDPHVDLTLPLDFLSQVLEDFSAGLCRDLPYHAVADIAFALQYIEREGDLIPDSLPDVGFADDAAVSNRVLVKHAEILREYALRRGFDWEELQRL